MRIISWNCNGLKSKIDEVRNLATLEPTLIFIQESRMKVASPDLSIDGYCVYHNLNSQYDGVTTYVMNGIDHHIIHHIAGRVTEVIIDGRSMINVYVKNSGRGLKNISDRKMFDVQFRCVCERIKPSLIMGDMNVADRIDSTNFDKNKAGCSDYEIESFHTLLKDLSLTDVHRYINGAVPSHTWWWNNQCKMKNVGMRLDYALIDSVERIRRFEVLVDKVSYDHAPIMLDES